MSDPLAKPVVVCPQCGGENPLSTGEAILRCAFCGVSLYIDRSRVVSHYLLPRLVDKGQAQEALRRWMAGNQTVKDLDRLATIGEVEPLLFPMWLFRSRGPQDNGGERSLVEPAAATPIHALADLKIPAGKLIAFGAGEPGVAATVPTVPLDTARTWLGGGGAGLTEQALVHVPLWRCGYRYQDRDYLAYVDGATGEVVAAVFPAKSEAPYMAVAAIGLVLFLVEGLAVSNVFFKLVLYAVTAAPLLAAAYAVTRKV
ncbi:MAG: hypothetical protein ACM3OB_02920 [Acidobacteriota bacterium]